MKGRWICATLLLLSLEARALEPSAGVQVTPLANQTTSWDGTAIVYPQGQPEITALMIEIAPGAETGWHRHPVPSFAYLLEGTLEVRLDDGRTRRLHPGEPLVEVINRDHIGRNVGSTPVKIVVFYAGAVGTPLSVKQEK